MKPTPSIPLGLAAALVLISPSLAGAQATAGGGLATARFAWLSTAGTGLYVVYNGAQSSCQRTARA